MNILHLNNEANITSGVTRVIYHIMNKLREDYNHYFIAAGGDGKERFSSAGLHCEILFRTPNIKNFLFYLFRIKKFCDHHKIDIIHCHHRYFDFLASFLNIRVITSVHSKVYGKSLFSYKSKEIITVSNSLKTHLINNFKIKAEKIKVINNFIDPDEYNAADKKDTVKSILGLSDNQTIIGYFGRFSREKGVDILLESMRNVQSQFPECILLMIGEGEEKNNMLKYIEENNMNVLVLQQKLKIYEFVNISEIIVLPSRIDPFPLIMLEAGLMKKSFIGTRVDGIPEFIENKKNGILISNENPKELEDAIISLLSNPLLRKELAENLYKKVMINSPAANYMPIYKSIYR